MKWNGEWFQNTGTCIWKGNTLGKSGTAGCSLLTRRNTSIGSGCRSLAFTGETQAFNNARPGGYEGRKEKEMNNAEYRAMLIANILERQTKKQFTREQLENKTIRSLEIIHDNID